MLSRSSALNLLVDSQAESNCESHFYPLTLFLHTFPQPLCLFQMTKVFYPNHPFHHPLILLIKSDQKCCLKLTLSPSLQRHNHTHCSFSFSDACAKKHSHKVKGKACQLDSNNEDLTEEDIPLPPAVSQEI